MSKDKLKNKVIYLKNSAKL
jgi:hypothetical protein